MQTTKKKPNIILIVLGVLASAFLGYLIAGAWYYNEFTFRMIGYALLVYAVVIVMYYTS